MARTARVQNSGSLCTCASVCTADKNPSTACVSSSVIRATSSIMVGTSKPVCVVSSLRDARPPRYSPTAYWSNSYFAWCVASRARYRVRLIFFRVQRRCKTAYSSSVSLTVTVVLWHFSFFIALSVACESLPPA